MPRRYSLPFFLMDKHHRPRKKSKRTLRSPMKRGRSVSPSGVHRGRPSGRVSILAMQPTKACPSCQQVLPVSKFAVDKRRRDGLSRYCKRCRQQKKQQEAKVADIDVSWKQNRQRQGRLSLKTCHACKRTLPAEAFHRSNKTKDGLRSTCKACRKEHQSEVQARYQQMREHHPTTEKTCTFCKRSLPIASFYSDKNVKDGYAIYCKECVLRMQDLYAKRWEKRRSTTPHRVQQKTCRGCHRTLPISQFTKNRQCLDGYSGTCNDCERERRIAMITRWQHEEKPLEKQCTHCQRILPASEFSKAKKSRDGLLYMCKACALEYYNDMKARWAQERARAQTDISLFAVTEKTCRSCQRTLPLSAFYHRKESRDGLNATCKDCDAREARQKNERRKARPKNIPARRRHQIRAIL
jgi:hypothetical protein